MHAIRVFPRGAAWLPAALALAACGAEPTGAGPHAGPGILHFSVDVAAPAFVRCGGEVPVTAHVTDGLGDPVAGVLVNFRAVAGGGSFFAGSGITGAAGTVKDYWTLGTAPNALNILEARGVDPETGAKQVYATDSVTTLTRIAFTATRPGTFWQIYTMKPDGTDTMRLTTNSRSDLAPVWSPDGSRIAFHSNRDGDGSQYEIYVMNADGTGVQRLTNSPGDDVDPAWSRDGTRIAFSSRRDGNFEIYVMNADGSSQVRATVDAGADTQPTWALSPGANASPVIAFVSDRYGNREILSMAPNGANLQRVTNNAAEDRDPEFSPDGDRLAFTSTRDGNPEIYVMARAGSGWGTPLRITTFSGRDEGPAWSPDGGSLAFGTVRHSILDETWAKGDIYRVRSDGTGLQRLTVNESWDYTPAWSACVAN